MSTALYRRYRPQTFEEVIGQEHVTDPLRAALRGGRVNHAYLFSGPRGCGKTTSARILARCLNCVEGPTDTPCGKCPSCVELATGGPGSLDVVEIDAASHNGVDDARDLRERASFAPVRDRFKVFILDEAHMVTSQGFNALLKLVEEPPAHVKFVFATTEPDKVLGTIKSRTHHYPFRLVPPEVMQGFLADLCVKEKISVAEGVLPLVIRAGGGSVRDSLSVLDQLMAGAQDGQVSYQRASALLGYTDEALLETAVDSLAACDGASTFELVEQLIESGHDPRRFVEDLLQRLRDLVILAVAGEGADGIFASLPQTQLDGMRRQAHAWGPAGLSRAADLTAAALTGMVGATSPRLQLELLLARILIAPSPQPNAPAAPTAPSGANASKQPAGKVSLNPDAMEARARAKALMAQKQAEKEAKKPAPSTVSTPAVEPAAKPEQNSETVVEETSAHSSVPEIPAQGPVSKTPVQSVTADPEPITSLTTPQQSQSPKQVSVQGSDPGAEIKKRWEEIVTALETISRVAHVMVQQNVHPGPYAQGRMYLITEAEGHAAAVNNRYLGHITAAVKQVTGKEIELRAATANEMTREVSNQLGQTPQESVSAPKAQAQSTPLNQAPDNEQNPPTLSTPKLREEREAPLPEQHDSPQNKQLRNEDAVPGNPESKDSLGENLPEQEDPYATGWGPVAVPGGGLHQEKQLLNGQNQGNPETFPQEQTPASLRPATLNSNVSVNPVEPPKQTVASPNWAEENEPPLPDDPDAFCDFDDEDESVNVEPTPQAKSVSSVPSWQEKMIKAREKAENRQVEKEAVFSFDDEEISVEYDEDYTGDQQIAGVQIAAEVLGATIIDEIIETNPR
ncbi:DNA polymerase III subunit gamma and tau [Actinomycetaceae bacterium TAE3-ERU4]|nr:DNA polymerase III subunit gamma and tau [Actinomycetaceae bacterium TAE3-ERU4]